MMVLELVNALKEVIPQTATVELMDGGIPRLVYDPETNVVTLCSK